MRSRLEIAVTDTGIGMSEEEIEKLFQPFRQANLSTSREYGGTGLGLTICRALSEALGGEIQVDTRPGKGSVFRLVLDQPIDANAEMVAKHYQDLEVEEQGLQRPEFRQSLSGRILLAEDGLDNQLLISTLLKREGLEVDIAGDGEQAVDTASQALVDGRPYDLILMDMQMPRLDGYGATTKLRRQGYTGPVVALTAHAMVGERERCMTAGCDDYLTKPISRAVLIAGVEAYLHRIRGGDSDLGATGEASPEKPSTRGAIHSTYAEDPDMRELIEGFIGRLPQTLNDIQLAHEGGDTERLRRLAHQLKGSAGGYGFLPVSQDAARLEKAVRQAESPDELESAMKRLTDTCERVEPVTRG